jgi:hypothetical protein
MTAELLSRAAPVVMNRTLSTVTTNQQTAGQTTTSSEVEENEKMAVPLVLTLAACGGSESGGDEGMMEGPRTTIEASGIMMDDSAVRVGKGMQADSSGMMGDTSDGRGGMMR